MTARRDESRFVARLRALCLSLPEVCETVSHGAPTWWAKTRTFATFADAESHHGKGRHGVWLKATPENQRFMMAAQTDRYFVPPYVGPAGWIGVHLDAGTDWNDLAELLRDAWRLAAPPALLRRLAAIGAKTPESTRPAPPATKRPRRANGVASPASRAPRKRR